MCQGPAALATSKALELNPQQKYVVGFNFYNGFHQIKREMLFDLMKYITEVKPTTQLYRKLKNIFEVSTTGVYSMISYMKQKSLIMPHP